VFEVSKTSVEVDDQALAEVQQALGGVSKREAINHALREYAAFARSNRAGERLRDRIERGELPLLTDPEFLRQVRSA
jgi:Arc/MetJ family transcription regulator